MIAFVQDWILAVWAMMLDSAFWLLVGILTAGLIHLLLHRENIARLVGGRSYGAVIRASLCLLYTSPSPRDRTRSRMPSSA